MTIFILGGLGQFVKDAWHYVTSAVRSDVPREVASKIISPISDFLDDSDIDVYYGLYEDSVEVWQRIHNIPNEHTITETYAIDTPFDWRRQHVMKMRVQGIDINTGQLIDSWITVESDTELSKGEWLNLAQEAVIDSPFGYSWEVDYVAEYEYYQKGINL